nr:MAG TPA: Large Terminase [Caudoviricetes sp.]
MFFVNEKVRFLRKLKKYIPTKFKAEDSIYDKDAADFAVMFIESLCHTKGTWAGKKFELIDWQEQIIRDLFGTLKPNGYRQFNTAYVEIPKKQGSSWLIKGNKKERKTNPDGISGRIQE